MMEPGEDMSGGGKMSTSSHVDIGPSESGTKLPGDDFKLMEHLCLSAMALDNQELLNIDLDTNAQEQMDEITALESIYGSDFILVESMQGLDLQSFMDELDLLSGQEGSLLDNRAVSGYTLPDVDIPMFIRYNEDQNEAKFNNGVHLCLICFKEQSGWSFAELQCKHYFCYACMKQYASFHINEGTVNMIQCPDTSCKESISPTLLKYLVGEEAYQRCERLLLQKTLDSMADIVYCPRCKMVCIEDNDDSAQCDQCFYSFCTLCRGRRHCGQECMTLEEKLHILQERWKGLHVGDEQRKKEKELINEILNLNYVKREAKQCPNCKTAIEKTEGCNKMTCEYCGKHFCYVCNKPIKGYEHFSNECNLFEEAEILNWERAMNPRRFEQEDVPDDFPLF